MVVELDGSAQWSRACITSNLNPVKLFVQNALRTTGIPRFSADEKRQKNRSRGLPFRKKSRESDEKKACWQALSAVKEKALKRSLPASVFHPPKIGELMPIVVGE